MFSFGSGRIDLQKIHGDALKPVHLLPSLFVMYILGGIVFSLSFKTGFYFVDHFPDCLYDGDMHRCFRTTSQLENRVDECLCCAGYAHRVWSRDVKGNFYAIRFREFEGERKTGDNERGLGA